MITHVCHYQQPFVRLNNDGRRLVLKINDASFALNGESGNNWLLLSFWAIYSPNPFTFKCLTCGRNFIGFYNALPLPA